MKTLRKILLLLIFCCSIFYIKAQNSKYIDLYSNQLFVDSMFLGKNSNDTLLVKFMFDEINNIFIVTLVPKNKYIFVFHDKVRYRQVFSHHKLKANRLTYKTEANENDVFKTKSEFRKTIRNNDKRKYQFQRWISCKGMKPITTDFKMVNDSLEQQFTINNKDTLVSVSLHEISFMSLSYNNLCKRKNKYYLENLCILDSTYEIVFHRDHCIGMEEIITASRKSVDSIRKSYDDLQKQFGPVLKSNDELKFFKEMKEVLLKTYKPYTAKNPCQDVRKNYELFNNYIDSISKKTCSVVKAVPTGADANYILAQARELDNLVSRWLASKDVVERKDIVKQCQTIIQTITDYVDDRGLLKEEQVTAMSVFIKAQQYFRTTCIEK